jgi:ATP adenylyltransferase/5',5'''-P-1,P-4-tetraphosphate phosphorylase II
MAKTKYKSGGIVKVIKLLTSLLFFIFYCNVLPVKGQQKPSLEYQVKAAFLFNFTKFVNWPSVVFKSADDPFVIGIVGDDPFGPYLDELVKGERLGTHKIVIQRYNNTSDVVNCHMLFINTNPLAQQEILGLTDNQNILTVSNTDNTVSRNGSICFFKQDNKIKIKINLAATKKSKLKISSKLLSVAKLN